MSEENKIGGEQVIMQATVKNPNKKPQVVKLNEAHATMDIAKNLIQDYTFLLTMSVIKTMFRQIKNPDEVLNSIYSSWEKRMSAQLAEETENYQKAIMDALQDSNAEASKETADGMKEYFDSYCRVRDNAVKMAKDAIVDINKLIKSEQPKKEGK